MVKICRTTANKIDATQEKNRLKESIELFKRIQNFQWLAHTTFILFLNKVDVLKEKFNTSDMVNYFQDYKG